jgi:hypothetical protein
VTSLDLHVLLPDLRLVPPDLLHWDLGASGGGSGDSGARHGRGVLRRCISASVGVWFLCIGVHGVLPRWAVVVRWCPPLWCCGSAGLASTFVLPGGGAFAAGCVAYLWRRAGGRGRLVAACRWLASVEVCWLRLGGEAYGGLFGCLLVASWLAAARRRSISDAMMALLADSCHSSTAGLC